jgi:large subunit ribosomal protein L23
MAALFDRFTKKRSGPPPAKPAAEKRADAQDDAKKDDAKKVAKKADVQEKKIDLRATAKAGAYANVLTKPHVSEKAAVLAEGGVYVFDVPTSANKQEIRKAVETTYGVHVMRVRTQRGIGKLVQRGKVRGRRKNWKKALVELKKGETIALVEGV